MLFNSEFLAQIPLDPHASALEIIAVAQSQIAEIGDWTYEKYEVLTEAYVLLQAMSAEGLISIALEQPEIATNEFSDDCKAIAVYLHDAKTLISLDRRRSSLDAMKARFAAGLSNGFRYEFSQADVGRMQTLINELRENIAGSGLFSDSHKARLLKRLEGLQAEVHKRVSDLDKFWGLIGDAGVVIGKFGSDAKPFVDRIVEISQIVWNAQKEAEEIPSNVPMPLLTRVQQAAELIEGEQSGL
ncbi:MAG: hypothetical protein V4723_18045 [Pseudomonadota bacterium]